MPLQITTTRAVIGIETTNAKIQIEQPRPEVNRKTTLPRLEIKSERSKIQIDQSVCFSEANLKDVFELTRQAAQFGKQRAIEGVQRMVREGDMLMKIENGGKPIPNIAKNNDLKTVAYNIGFMPKSRPKISATKAKLDIQVKEGKIDVNVQVSKPKITYEPGKVDIYMKQKNSIKIEYVDEKI